MDTVKDRNGMCLMEAEGIKKKWQEYTEWLDKKDLNDPDIPDSVIAHLEPDILEDKVKWACGILFPKQGPNSGPLPLEKSRSYWTTSLHLWEAPGSSDSKESAHSAGDPSLIPVLERPPGEGNGNPLQYSCLENPMDRGA